MYIVYGFHNTKQNEAYQRCIVLHRMGQWWGGGVTCIGNSKRSWSTVYQGKNKGNCVVNHV